MKVRKRTSSNVVMALPPSAQKPLRVRERLSDETMPDVVAFLRAALRRAAEELSRTSPRQHLLALGASAAELLLTKIVGTPQRPADEEASGAVVMSTQTLMEEAKITLAHLSSMPLQRYLEASERGIVRANEKPDA